MSESKSKLSPTRQALRVIVWVAFAGVLFLRFVAFKPEPRPRAPVGWEWAQDERRFRRPPTLIQTPVAEVPKDFPRLEIKVAANDVELLRGYFWNGRPGARGGDRPEVAVTVQEGATIYTNVAMHLKGAAGSFRPFDDKPALTLNFGKNAQGQRFHGLAKLSLNNSVQDPTYLCETIARETFLEAGVPVPQAQFATVVLNGRDLGLYVMIEGYNKDFLRKHFKNVKGNLYDGGFCQEVNRDLDVNSGEHPEDRSDIERLLAATREPDLDRRWQQFTNVLDMDRFITMLALEVMLWHWDGYGLNRNNWRLFHDLDTDRLVFMPHGLDQLFEFPPHRFPGEPSLRSPMRGKVAAQVLTSSEGARLFFERIESLQKTVFTEERLLNRVQELAARLRPTLVAYGPNLVEWHDTAVASLRDRISRRVRSVAKQMESPTEPLPFDDDGMARLLQWKERYLTTGSSFELETVEENGQKLLHLAATGGGGTASWRTRVNLPVGRYRLQGRARVDQVGVGGRLAVRVSGSARASGSVTTTTDWVDLSHVFAVEGYLSEVVLVCEFSSPRGEAWFDVQSLHLVHEAGRSPDRRVMVP